MVYCQEQPVKACMTESCKHAAAVRKRKRKEKFTLLSDHNGSLRRQPGAAAAVNQI
jgi:hypothetical protein